MSPSRLLGWEPAEYTTYVYEGDRLVESVTVREPEFSAWDRALLLGDRARSEIQQGRHGLPISVATDPANRGRFAVPLPTTDFAAEALSRAQDAYRKKYPDAPFDALLWRVEMS